MAFGLLVVVNIAGNFAGGNILQKHEAKHKRIKKKTSGDFVDNFFFAGLWLVDTSTTHIVIPSSQVADLFVQLHNFKRRVC